MYDRGKTLVPPLAVCSGVAFATLAYLAAQKYDWQKHNAVQAYGSAAALSFSLIPYTLIVMGSTNGGLISVAEAILKQDAGGGSDNVQPSTDVIALVQQWSILNLVRGILQLGGAIAGIYGTLIDIKL